LFVATGIARVASGELAPPPCADGIRIGNGQERERRGSPLYSLLDLFLWERTDSYAASPNADKAARDKQHPRSLPRSRTQPLARGSRSPRPPYEDASSSSIRNQPNIGAISMVGDHERSIGEPIFASVVSSPRGKKVAISRCRSQSPQAPGVHLLTDDQQEQDQRRRRRGVLGGTWVRRVHPLPRFVPAGTVIRHVCRQVHRVVQG